MPSLNQHRQPIRILALLWALSALLAVGCSDDSTSGRTASSLDDGPYERVSGRLMGDLTLTGQVWAMGPRPWQRLCVQDLPEGQAIPLCTTTDERSRYRSTGLFSTSGLALTTFTDRLDRERGLSTLYDLNSSLTTAAAQAHVNPLTDTLARVYTLTRTELTPPDCMSQTACTHNLNHGLDQHVLATIQLNLERWLRAAWPEEATDDFPWQQTYQTNLQNNPWLGFFRRLDFQHHQDPATGAWQVSIHPFPSHNCPNTDAVTTATYAELATNLFRGTTTDLDQAGLAQLDTCALPATASTPDVTVHAGPDSGSAPLTTVIRVETSPHLNTTGLTATLTNSRGQVLDAWSESSVTRTLTSTGTHQVAVEVITDSGARTGGTQIIVGTAEDSSLPPTWGETGSCRPPETASVIGNLGGNTCFEFQDGTLEQPGRDTLTCDDSTLKERGALIYSPGVCGQTAQYGEDILGVCTHTTSQTRVFYYRSLPVGLYAETAQQEHDRLLQKCRDGDDTWESRL